MRLWQQLRRRRCPKRPKHRRPGTSRSCLPSIAISLATAGPAVALDRSGSSLHWLRVKPSRPWPREVQSPKRVLLLVTARLPKLPPNPPADEPFGRTPRLRRSRNIGMLMVTPGRAGAPSRAGSRPHWRQVELWKNWPTDVFAYLADERRPTATPFRHGGGARYGYESCRSEILLRNFECAYRRLLHDSRAGAASNACLPWRWDDLVLRTQLQALPLDYFSPVPG